MNIVRRTHQTDAFFGMRTLNICIYVDESVFFLLKENRY